MTNDDFYGLLFDEGDYTNYTIDVQRTGVFQVGHTIREASNFFCINPLHPEKDLGPVSDNHSPNRPRRADVNVVKFRNILMEFDKGTLAEQGALMEDYGMPWTTAVFSGGKSMHYILSLTEPISREEYSALVDRIYRLFNGAIDKACKNPSRMSRCPGVLRKDKGEWQKLSGVRSRVTFNEINALLDSFGISMDFDLTPSMESLLGTSKKANSDRNVGNLEKAVTTIIGNSSKGNLHEARSRAAYLAGGYVGSNFISFDEALRLVMDIVVAHGTDNIIKSETTVRACMLNGMSSPIV